MISFIIIGKNEGWKLTLCLEKVFETITLNSIKHYEVIYVDSKSTDDSINRAKRFENIKVVLLTGDCNAAIARNVGANLSSGEVLFFIDGDMELIPEVFHLFYTERDGIEHPFLSGNYDNYYYKSNWKFIDKDNGLSLIEDKFTPHVGGLFLITKDLWNSIGGMRNIFNRSQDIDLALRLAKKGVLLLRKKQMLVHHHMIPYLDKNRKWQMLFDGSQLYARPLLYRENFLNKYSCKRMLRNDYTALLLLLCLLTMFLVGYSILFFYTIALLMRVIVHKKDFFSNFVFFFVRDIQVLIGFVFFFPRKSQVAYIITESK